jgi:hypothetical protein
LNKHQPFKEKNKMNNNQHIDDLLEILKKFKSEEPEPNTHQEKQAAITIAEFEECVQLLILEHHIPLLIIQAILLNLWVLFEAPVRGVSQYKIDHWSMTLSKVIQKIMYKVQTTLDYLPDPEQTPDMQEFGEAVCMVKAQISDDFFKHDLSEDESFRCCAFVVVQISKVIDNLIEREVHPQIISNVMFSRWLRLMTISASTPETHYQKMEYYFEELIVAARNYVPKLFYF